MPIPVPAPSFQPISTLELVKSAMFEINYLAAGENPSAEDAAWGLQKLQRLIDKLNAVRQAIYSVLFFEFSLIANHAPHTIGPDGEGGTRRGPGNRSEHCLRSRLGSVQ